MNLVLIAICIDVTPVNNWRRSRGSMQQRLKFPWTRLAFRFRIGIPVMSVVRCEVSLQKKSCRLQEQEYAKKGRCVVKGRLISAAKPCVGACGQNEEWTSADQICADSS